jgi:DNA uptake protein ComE-like DNA-binding protein
MLHDILHWLKSFLSLNKSEQRGILLLVFLIIITALFNLFLPEITDKENDFETEVYKNEISAFISAQQKVEDSIRIEQLQSRGQLNKELALQKLHPFTFNPNELPEEIWAKLGLSKKQIKAIKNYEAKGGKFRKKEDLGKIYCISEAEYNILEPYINIPRELKTVPIQAEKKPKIRKTRYYTTEINSADSTVLVRFLKLSPWIAARVIKYRNLLGGFTVPGQLTEVYGFDSVKLETIKSYVRVDTSLIHKININKASFKEILKHPYISYEITKKIVNYRSKKGPFRSTEELMEEEILSPSLYVKLKPYLKVEKLDKP